MKKSKYTTFTFDIGEKGIEKFTRKKATKEDLKRIKKHLKKTKYKRIEL
jgi:3-methyladenine DNA glycosylase AlkD